MWFPQQLRGHPVLDWHISFHTHTPTETHTRRDTVWWRYNAVNFLPNPHNRQPITCRGVFCEFNVWIMFHCCRCSAVCNIMKQWPALYVFLYPYDIPDRVITALDCTWEIHVYLLISSRNRLQENGPLTRYVKLRVAHAPGMSGTFSPPPQVSDPDMRHGTCVTHVPWCMPGSLTSGFLWRRWRRKRSRLSRRMHNPQFYVSGKRSMPRGPFADNSILILVMTFSHVATSHYLTQYWTLSKT